MAKIKIDFDTERKFERQTKRLFNVIRSNKKVLGEIGLFLTERIRNFGISGKPLKKGREFPLLADLTIDQRRYLSRFNPAFRLRKPGFSNINLSGQLWKSLAFEIDGPIVTVQFKDTPRKGYLTGTGKRTKVSKAASTNRKLGELLANKKGKLGGDFGAFEREFIDNDKNIRKRINGIVLRQIRKSILKINRRG